MLIGQTNLDVANTSINTAVGKIFNALGQTVYRDLFAVLPAAGTSMDFVVVDGLPQVRELIGPIEHKNLRASKKNVALRKWEATFDLPRELVEKDQSGVVGQRVSAFSARLETMPDKIAWDAILANSITGYDGQAALSDAHPNVNGTTADNLSTAAFSFAEFRAGQEAAGDLTDENGEPLDVNLRTIIVGEELRRTALEIAGPMRPVAMKNDGTLDGTSSIVAATGFENYDGQNCRVIVWKRMRNSEWLLADTASGDLKPWAFVEFEKFRLISQLTEASDSVYERETYSWSARGYYSPVPMAWQKIYGSVTA